MKAVVYYGPGDIRVENRPEPVPKPDNLIVRVKCCAICGSDLKLAAAGNPRCKPPRIIGHEMSGHIVHAGSNVKGFPVGERITLATTIGCGKCYYCSAGRGNICPDAKPISNELDGAFAEYVEIPFEAVTGGNVIRIPDSVPDEAAALSEPLSCAVNGQELAGIKEWDRVLVIGGGPLGAIHARLSNALGARDVMMSEVSKKRLQLLSGLKDVFLIDGGETDVEQVVRRRTGGLGADAVIVCAPVCQAHEQAIKLVRKGGTVCFFASLPKGASEITMDSRVIHYGELRITGVSDSRPEHVEKALRLMSEGSIDMASLITHRLPLEDFHKGLELMKSGESMKVLVFPGGVAE